MMMIKLEFKDSKSNDIQIGDKIKIISEYTFHKNEGKEAIVFWNPSNGRYEFKPIGKKGKALSFFHVREFELIERSLSPEVLNKITI